MSADLGQLYAMLASAKVDETEAKNRRIELEERIVAAMFPDGPPERGSATLAGGAFRCTAKFELGYKADIPGLCAVRDVPQGLLPIKLVQKVEFDEKAYEALRVSHPAVFAKVAAHVTTKPAKPSLTLKV